MPDHVATCTECGHVWIPQKPPADIEQPRCSRCDATGRAILFEREADVADAVQRSVQEPEIVREAKRKRRRDALQHRVAEFIERLKGTAPSGADDPVAREVREPFWEANALSQALDDRGAELRVEALEAVHDRLADLEAEIEGVVPDLDRLDDLDTAIEERTRERDHLHSRIADLEDEKDDLAQRVEELREDATVQEELLGDLADKDAAFKKGYEFGESWGRDEAQAEFAITIPCSKCGNPIWMAPGSEMHRQAVQWFQAAGWVHETCPPPESSPGWLSAEDY